MVCGDVPPPIRVHTSAISLPFEHLYTPYALCISEQHINTKTSNRYSSMQNNKGNKKLSTSGHTERWI